MASVSEAAPTISRVTRSKKAAMATYDRLSGVYDLLAGAFEWSLTAEGLRELGAKPGERVLEIGFGAGRALVSLAGSVGPDGEVCGVDISLGMVNAAMAKVRDSRVQHAVELCLGDGAALPFASGSFDCVFMSFVLELFDSPEIPVVLSELKRVLKPGGRACIVALTTRGERGSMLRLYEWAHEHFPNYADCRPIGTDGFLADAGFDIVRSRTESMSGLPVEVVLASKSPPERGALEKM